MAEYTTSNRIGFQDEKGRRRTPEQMFLVTCKWLKEAMVEVTYPQLERDVRNIQVQVTADPAGWLVRTKTMT